MAWFFPFIPKMDTAGLCTRNGGLLSCLLLALACQTEILAPIPEPTEPSQGEKYEKLGLWQEAYDAYVLEKKRNPSPKWLSKTGLMAMKIGAWETALQNFLALKNPKNVHHEAMAQAWLELGFPNKALPHALKAYAHQPSPGGRLQLAKIYVGEKQLAKALPLAQSLVFESLYEQESWPLLMDIYIQLGLEDHALKFIKKLPESKLWQAWKKVWLGDLARHRKLWKQAKIFYREALEEASPAQTEAMKGLALVHEALGQKKQAKIWFNRALET